MVCQGSSQFFALNGLMDDLAVDKKTSWQGSGGDPWKDRWDDEDENSDHDNENMAEKIDCSNIIFAYRGRTWAILRH